MATAWIALPPASTGGAVSLEGPLGGMVDMNGDWSWGKALGGGTDGTEEGGGYIAEFVCTS